MFATKKKVNGQYQKKKRDGFEPAKYINAVYQGNTEHPQLWKKRILIEKLEDDVQNTELEKKVWHFE